MKTHHLKTTSELFQDVKLGKKNFDVRKNDRNFRILDEIVLQEYSLSGGYSGNEFSFEVESMDWDLECLEDDYIVLGLDSQFEIVPYKVNVGDIIHDSEMLSWGKSGTKQGADLRVVYVLSHEQFPQGIKPGCCVYSYEPA